MKPSSHVIASAGAALGIQAAWHSPAAAAGCFFSGVLIDLDHYLDYFIVHKKFPLKYKDLADFCMDVKVTKAYLFLHTYEGLALFWALIFTFSLGKVWIGIALGLTTHMLFDQWTNPIRPLFYFLAFRIRNRFEKTKILSPKYFQCGNL